MPLFAMVVARFMMFTAVIGSVSLYFYLYILRDPYTWQTNVGRHKLPLQPWDHANRKNVIIIRDPAIKTSVVGQLFNQHPGVFYVNEPLYPFEMFKTLNYTKESEYNGQVRAFLDNLFNCRFYGYKDYLTFLSHPGLTSPRFRLSSKTLSSPPLCFKEVESYTNTSELLTNCPLLEPSSVSRVCARKAHAVVSVLPQRAPTGSLMGLLPILTSEAMSMRILYVVQDPRAGVWDLINTQNRKPWQIRTFENQVDKVCYQMSKEINSSFSLPARVRDQFVIVRYEDVIRNLSTAARNVFRSVDIDLLPDVTEWVDNSAHSWLARESTETSGSREDWRLHMSEGQVAHVQDQCSYVMRLLGYRSVHNLNELRDRTYSLLTEPEISLVILI